MSAELLAKLRVKNQPVTIESVDVKVKRGAPREEVALKTKIEKRIDEAFDREQFMNAIADKFKTVPKIPKPITPKPAVPLRVQAAQDDGLPAEITDGNQALTKPVATIKKPKKLKKKLKLVDSVPTSTPRKRKRKSPIGVVRVLPPGLVQIGDTSISDRLGKQSPNVLIKASSYYMNNREIFINFINSLFAPYKAELLEASKSASCESRGDGEFSLMGHQKIVRDYINMFTPYRGALLYHGLGSGKTCSSIAIAEGMKNDKKIIVMTPASLRRNYFEELKKCGDTMYRKNQFWEFVPATAENIQTLSAVLNLTVEYIRKEGGAWLINASKPSNFETLDNPQKLSLDNQLDEMIKYKYQFISYNGLRKRRLRELTKNGQINPFDNAVIIVDEAHNLVSRIVNKLERSKDSVSIDLYNLLMKAENVKIILLSGTPIINYPNEIAILFNMLRGYIKTWHFSLTINSERRVTNDTFKAMFKSTVLGGNVSDLVSYNSSGTTLTITRNPFGFINKTSKGNYDGVRVGDRGEMTDDDFVKHITNILKKNKFTVRNVRVDLYKALPDKKDDFKTLFIDGENNVTNMNLFKRRIVGLTSYFRSAQENLMPQYSKGRNFHVIRIPMSDFQFGIYEEARVAERKLELNNARKRKKQQGDIYEDSISTYRIFSRAFCNFVFPRPEIKRPMPNDESVENAVNEIANNDEDLLDGGLKQENVDGRNDADEIGEAAIEGAASYDERIKSALSMLNEQKEKFLTPEALEIYSPKFLEMLDNIKDPEHRGCHMVYSQFRTLEGIGIFKLVLEANGFAEFKLKKDSGNWVLDIKEEDRGKPTFALYTGTESDEEKEIVRNVFNGDWKFIPPTLEAQIKLISGNNLFGEVVKLFMITASGAEGISLRNTRYVHIMEPYWHPVRIQQVIGRARRICSHQELPEELRTVDVFLYLMEFSEEQLSSDATIELRLKDTSKLSDRPISSDEALYEIATLKEEVTDKLLMAVKEASFDCQLHSQAGDGEKLQCFQFSSVDPNRFSYEGSYANEDVDAVAEQNLKEVTLDDLVEFTADGIKYALDRKTGAVYDFDSYERKQLVRLGTLVETDGNYELKFI